MEFVKSKNQYTDAILFDDNTNKDDLFEFLSINCGCDVQLLGVVEKEYHPDGVEVPYLNGMDLPVATVISFYICGKKKEIISIPKGYYINWNGKNIKIIEAKEFEKEWDIVEQEESKQTTFGSDEEI